jgi:hypothetical protein
MSRILESDANSTVEVTWEPPGNDSRVDIYHFKVIADLEGINCTLYAVETMNTTVLLSIRFFPYNINITVCLSAIDSCGIKSIPAVLIMSYSGTGKS